MSEQYVPNLGGIPSEDAKRDAIHVAIAPVIAGEDLEPGSHVKLSSFGYALGDYKETIGIVDPFLNAIVCKGERFWLFLYPNTVTSLRHVWTHPAFRASLKETSHE